MALSDELTRALAQALAINGTALSAELVAALNAYTALASGKIIVGDSNGAAADVTLSGDATISNTGVLTLAAQVINGTNLKNGATAGVIGAVEVIHWVTLAAGALATTDVVLTHKTRITDAWLVLQGAGVANTVITVGNGAGIITNNMIASGSDKDLVRAASLDDANWEIAAAGTLRFISSVGATQPACTVYARGVRVA